MEIKVRFTDDDWGHLQKNWSAWWAGEIDRPMVMIETMNPLFSGGRKILTREWMIEKPANEVLDYFQELLEGAYYLGDSWPKFFYNHGPGIAAGFLGAKVHSMPEQNTVWFESKEPVTAADLHLKYDPANRWWQRIQELTESAVKRWGNQVAVAHTDIGGNLDILSSFVTANQLLLELYDSPEEVIRVSKEITTAWIIYYEKLYEIVQKGGRGTCNWAAVWSPGRTCMHQSDFCYMISPEKFILPDLYACFEIMDHAFYHLDGKGQIPHLDMLLSLENLAGIQWIPGAGQPDPENWPGLLKKIIVADKRCQVYVSAEGARKIVREIGGKGFAFYVMGIKTPDDADAFLKVLAKEDISLKNNAK